MSQNYAILNYVPEVYRSLFAENVTTQFIDPSLNDDQLHGAGHAKSGDLTWALQTSDQTITMQELHNAYERTGIAVAPEHVINMEFHLPVNYAMLAKPDDYIWAHNSEAKYTVVSKNDNTGWGQHNHWIHRSDATVDQLAIFKRGTQPIVEFNADLEMSQYARIVRSWLYEGQATSQEPTVFDCGSITSATFANGTLVLDGDLVDEALKHPAFWVKFSNVDVRAAGVVTAYYNDTLNQTYIVTDLHRTLEQLVTIVPTNDSLGGLLGDAFDVPAVFRSRWTLVSEEWIATEAPASLREQSISAVATDTTVEVSMPVIGDHSSVGVYVNGTRHYDVLISNFDVVVRGVQHNDVVEIKYARHTDKDTGRWAAIEVTDQSSVSGTSQRTLLRVVKMEQVWSSTTPAPVYSKYGITGKFVGTTSIIRYADSVYHNELHVDGKLFTYRDATGFHTCWSKIDDKVDSTRLVNPDSVTKTDVSDADMYAFLSANLSGKSHNMLKNSDRGHVLFDTFTACVNVSDVMVWAANEYTKTPFDLASMIETSLPSTTLQSCVDATYRAYELDPQRILVYGDSSMGVPHIVTLAKMNVLSAVMPVLAGTKILAHDGHIWDMTAYDEWNTRTMSRWVYQGMKSVSSRSQLVPGTTLAYVSNESRVISLVADFVTDYQPITNKVGAVWYAPSMSEAKQYDGNTWVVINVSSVFVDVSPIEILKHTLLKLETALYQACDSATNPTTINFGLADVVGDATFGKLLKLQYDGFVRASKISAKPTIYNDPFTWRYRVVDYNLVTFANPTKSTWFEYWETLYEDQFGTAFIVDLPWKLQGFDSKPEWWDTRYPMFGGYWPTAMWLDIIAGTVNGAIGAHHGYTFIPVNWNELDPSKDVDYVFPPFTDTGASFIGTTDALDMTVFNVEFGYGEDGPVETAWKRSVNFPYAIISTALQVNPHVVFNALYGEQTTQVDGLTYWTRTSNVPRSTDVAFHGDYINGSMVSVVGINQWLVNWGRCNGISLDDVRECVTSAKSVLCMVTQQPIEELVVETSSGPLLKTDVSSEFRRVPRADDTYEFTSLIASLSSIGMWEAYNSEYKKPIGWGDDWNFTLNAPTEYVTNINVKKTKKSTFTESNGVYISSTPHRMNTGDYVLVERSVNVDRYTSFYVVKIDENRIALASSEVNATTGATLQSNIPIGTVVMGCPRYFVETPFENDPRYVRYYTTDETVTYELPLTVTSIQSVVDVVFGMVDAAADIGLTFNDLLDEMEFDMVTQVRASWDNELAKFVNRVMIGYDDQALLVAGTTQRKRWVALNAMRNRFTLNHPGSYLIDTTPTLRRLPQSVIGLFGYPSNRLSDSSHVVFRERGRSFAETTTMYMSYTQSRTGVNDVGGFAAMRWRKTYDCTVVTVPAQTNLGIVCYDLATGSVDSGITLTYQTMDRGGLPPIGTSLANYEDRFNTHGHLTSVKRRVAEETGYDLTALDSFSVGFATKYQFWRGAIQKKGTRYSVEAFTNSSTYNSTTLDELWAFEVARYGSVEPRVAPILKVDAIDFQGNELKLDLT